MISSFRIATSPAIRRTIFSSPAQMSRLFSRHTISPYSVSPVKLFATTPEKKEEVVQEEGLKGKVAELWGKYGYIAVGTYITVYISTLGGIFVSMDYDIFNAATFGFDPVGAVKKFCDLVEYITGNKDLPGYIRENPRVGTFAIAWVMTKFTEPVRLAGTIAIVPSIARLFGKVPAEGTSTK